MEKTLVTEEDYRNAVVVQSAVNLTAIVREFADVIMRIHSDCNGETEKVWKHPICFLYADKIRSLAFLGHKWSDVYDEMYDICLTLGKCDRFGLKTK